ncbi:hypothetical protein KPH14_004809 [Odynerus spinipes]|uniref:non-specific serine/threonine protein kinase n=1 Tax=Odynerus spinipes TaxID=1348599 RepID=A0AAD9VPN8_9HYME|nr:hypothetical protein KPH14_004809 [Odynerus spinipes]
MENKTSQEHNPWSNLTTVTTFDRGNNVKTTVRWENRSETESNGQVIPCVAPSTSLLIESLIQQICTMFEGDTIRRNKLYFAICDKLHKFGLIDTSYNLIEYEGIRGQYQQALYRLVAVARAAIGSESPLNVPSCLMAEWSRYHREFHEISFIASGGFGDVYKALHRLDGIEYAIKKIVVRSCEVKTILQHLEEVKSLAKLNHTNIVSYKTAWIEPTLITSTVPSLLNAEDERNKKHVSRPRGGRIISYRPRKTTSFNDNDKLASDSSHSNEIDGQDIFPRSNKEAFYRTGQRIIEQSSSESAEDTASDIVSFRNDSKSNCDYSENNGNYTKMNDSNDESCSNNQICQYKSQMDHCYATLYIQMALCEKTLQQWLLDERNVPASQMTITTILTQILQGVHYIHSLGIVHHDIKPSNIFITTTEHLQIQLGDFGLACPLQRESHTTVFGTHMYAAPEQLKGQCNPKSDIYSIGIVLVELLIHTETHMERSYIIDGLKKGQLPVSLTVTHPKWAHVVSQLVQEDPNKRPSTNELLQYVTEDKDITIANLKDDIVKKDNTIHELEKQIAVLQAKITELKPSLES